ncbi:MAG: class I SAM-dependent RNA methyltransferase [Lutimonas sp.]
MEDNFTMIAKTLFGFESILSKELLKLGAKNIKEGVRSVSFEGDLGFMYKANLALRTAIRILVPIKSFQISDEEDLYQGLKTIVWEEYMDLETTFALNSTTHSENFTHSHYISLKSKDAIADYFRDKYGKRPDVDIEEPDLLINVHIDRDQCNISLDCSGDALYKRGYRTATNIAPMNEVFAAGLILMTGYDGAEHFIDPMCGSGTMLIEAAMIANHIPANINRENFGFQKWKNYDAGLFELIKGSLLKKVRSSSRKILGYDKAPSAVMKAKQNIENANLSDFIEVEKKDFFTTEKPFEGKTVLCFNPPYGERLKIDVPTFYKEIGNTLKQGYPSTDAWFVTSDLEQGIKNVGLRASKKIKVFNGSLECRFVKYEMYEGSKKASKN